MYCKNQCYFSKGNRFWNAKSDPKFGRRGSGVSYINARKERFWNTNPDCILLRKNFWNGIPTQKYL
jgi:hypothetical protein